MKALTEWDRYQAMTQEERDADHARRWRKGQEIFFQMVQWVAERKAEAEREAQEKQAT